MLAKTILSIIFSLWSLFLVAQTPQVWENKIYRNTIRTVQLLPNTVGGTSPIPIVALHGGGLYLSFDDVDPQVKDYMYAIQHCNKDWTVSNLNELQYMEGFAQADIRNYDFSFRVSTNYVHYQIRLPNQDIRWTKSGNYILKVFEDLGGNEKELVFTRRFMVAKPMGSVAVEINYPANVRLQQTHHELDFSFAWDEGVQIRNPIKELSAVVLQNGRWDSAVKNIVPMRLLDNKVVFDYQNKILFPASKEWRELDIRSFENRSNQVYDLQQVDGGVDIVLYPDTKRTYKAHHYHIDLNGSFVIQNTDRFRNLTNANGFTRTYDKENNIQSDYALVYFSLDSPTEYEGEVYVFGGLTDWTLNEEFKMEYLPEERAYTTQAWLKQGYYDYMYAYVPKGTETIDLSELEGDWYETKNEYTVLVYYRPFGQRYDALIGTWQGDSGE